MRTERFNLDRHMRQLERILTARNCPIPSDDEMPALGFVAYSGAIPVAFAFVRRVEGGFGQLDGIATNPACTKEKRQDAMDLVFEECIKEAKSQGIKGLIGYTLYKSTGERSTEHGFEKLPHTMYALNLKV